MSRKILLIVFTLALMVAAFGCSDDAALQSARSEIAEGDRAIASLSAELEGVNETVASLSAGLEGANATIRKQQDNIMEWEAANATLVVNLDDALGAIDEWQVSYADKERELAEAREELEAAIANAVSERAVIQGLLDKARADLDATRAVLAEVQSGSAAVKAAERRVQSLTERADELEAQIVGFRSEITRIADEHTRLQAEYYAFLEQRCSIRSDETPHRTTIHDISYDILTPSDPTSLQSVTYIGRGERNVYDSRLSRSISIDAYLFKGLYSEMTVEFRVNPEFGSKEVALEQVDKFASAFGRLPAILLSRLESVVIHKDGGTWAASWGGKYIHLTVDGDEHIRRGTLEEALIHEAAHASLDGAHRNSAGWREAQMQDCVFISDYARDNPDREDVAESFTAYYALRHSSERLTESDKAAIRNAIPNRIAYFDEQGLGSER